jgi:hypothetical protein
LNFAYCGKSEVGYARAVISPGVREKLKSMGLIEEIGGGLVVTAQGLRRIELGK